MTPTSSLKHLATERLGSACAGWGQKREDGTRFYSILIQSKKAAKENQSEPPSPPPQHPALAKTHIQTQIVSLFSSLLHPYIYIYIYTNHFPRPPVFYFFYFLQPRTHTLYLYHGWHGMEGFLAVCLSVCLSVGAEWGLGKGVL